MNRLGRILPLLVASFASGTQVYVFVGLLGEMAREFNVSIGLAGQIATVYAIVFALGAPVAGVLASRFERRGVLLGALIALAVLNAGAALAGGYASLMALRIAAAVAATCVLPIASAAAVALTAPEARGRALALVAGGTSASFVLGIPIGSAIGGLYGWRASFLFAAVLAAVAAVVVRFAIPRVPSAAARRAPLADAFRHPGVTAALLSIFIAFVASFTVVAYIGPVATAATGATGAGVGAFQLCIGIGSLIGVPLGGWLVDRGHERFVAPGVFLVMTVTLAIYSALLIAPGSALAAPVLALIILAGAACLFTLVPAMQARMVSAAPDAAPLLLGMSASAMFFGQGAGAMIGGFVADHVAFAAIGLVGAVIALAAFAATVLTAPRPAPVIQPTP